jgi:hypothetical protein
MMDTQRLALRTGKELQLVIAASNDLPSTLASHRGRRQRQKVKMAAGLGGATTVVVGGALWAANIGFWTSVGAALGLATIPLIITLAGTGKLAFGLPWKTKDNSPVIDEQQLLQLELTYCCFNLLARADGRISEEEQVVLRSVLLQYPLSDEQLQAIQERSFEEILADATQADTIVRRQVLQGTWMLAEADGVSPEEEVLFADLARKLGLESEVLELKRHSRDLQATANDLVTSMFRTCQQVLSPTLGTPRTNEFLEALAQIAATPSVRRSLRNSLSSGFSAGGVGRTLDEHAEASKLVAQAYNSILAVYGLATPEQKEARSRLLELADGTTMGKTKAKNVCSDVSSLFNEALKATASELRP